MTWRIVLALVVLAGGCIDNQSDGTPGGQTSLTSTTSGVPCTEDCAPIDPTTPVDRLEFHDCKVYSLVLQGDREAMVAQMPPGFTPDPGAGSVQTFGLDAYACALVVLGNVSAIREVTFFVVGAAVNAPQEVADPSHTDYYWFEIGSSDASVRNALVNNGFSVQGGGYGLSFSGAVAQATYYDASGAPLYDYSAGGPLGNGSAQVQQTLRTHQGSVHARWVEDVATPNPEAAGILTVHGGAVQELSLLPSESIPAASGGGWNNFTIYFESTEAGEPTT